MTFDIDANGILSVAAKDKGTGKEQKITITASSGLSKDEVDKMVRDGEAHAEEDRQKRDMAEARNQADSLAYTAERTLRDAGDKVSAELKSEVEGKVAAVRSALNGQDVAYIRRTMQELSDTLQKIGSAVYGQPGQGPAGEQPGGGPQGAPGDTGGQPGGQQQDGTVEGEYREM